MSSSSFVHNVTLKCIRNVFSIKKQYPCNTNQQCENYSHNLCGILDGFALVTKSLQIIVWPGSCIYCLVGLSPQ